jgi:hypothetical protein
MLQAAARGEGARQKGAAVQNESGADLYAAGCLCHCYRPQ